MELQVGNVKTGTLVGDGEAGAVKGLSVSLLSVSSSQESGTHKGANTSLRASLDG